MPLPPQPQYMVEMMDCPSGNIHFRTIHATVHTDDIKEAIILKKDAHLLMECEDVWIWERIKPSPEDDGPNYQRAGDRGDDLQPE
jgi:hypothetical protein